MPALSRSAAPLARSLRLLVLYALALGTVLLSGCAAATKPVRAVGLMQKDLVLAVTIDPDANDSSPVAVDVVAVDDKKTLDAIAALTAAEWFAKRNDFLRMKAKKITVLSREWVPGEVVPDVHVPGTLGKDGVLLFARYSTKGEHRAVLPAVGHVVLLLKAEDFVLKLPNEPKPKDSAAKG